MKRPVILVLIAIFGFVVADARAQNASMSAELDAASAARSQPQRTPVMIVHETAQAKAEADAPKPQSKTDASGPEKPKASEAAQHAAAGPSPLVVPAAQSVAQPAAALGFESTGNPRYDQLIKDSAARNGIDPNLIVAVMRQESGYNSRARSYKGAMGLMQLMPATARRFGVTNFYDPAQNIEGGARYLRFLMDTFNGDIKLVLAGYNAGEHAVFNYGNTIPPYRETRNYVRAITARYNQKNAARPATVVAAAPIEPAAPTPATFSGRASSRLSNNY
jgi:soluble lytic murein transglycosylase-like protein